jgi:IS30 family transposase
MTKKNYCHLTLEQRYKIEALLKAGHKAPFISVQLNVDRSTLYRELNRNRTKTGCYSAHSAHEISEEKKERFSHNRKFNLVMELFIRDKLSNEQWSPEQISGFCKKHVIPMVSHERIYQFIYQDKAEGGQLYRHLRVASKKYRKRYGSGRNKRNVIKDRVSIDLRTDCINNKERVGDWEIDTIVGKDNKGAIVTIAERATAFVLIARLNGKNATELAKAVVRLMAPFKDLVLSITSDNGTEFAFSVPALFSKGTRSYLLIKYSPGNALSFWLKLSRTRFSNKIPDGFDSIIPGNLLSEIKFQIRYKF